MVIGDRQKLGLARGEPVLGGGPLALRAMAVAARVVGDVLMSALLAACDMAAERGGFSHFRFWLRTDIPWGTPERLLLLRKPTFERRCPLSR